jgi:flagellar hook-associated protein 2
LSQVADAINGASDNAGVTATVANVDSGYKLLLTANDTGSANALTATYSGADPFSMTTLNLARSGGPSFTASDLDAVMILDGSSSLTATRSSNTVTDLIGGVTLTLQNAGTVTVKVARDTAAVTKSIQSFVDAYNSLRGTLDTQSKGNLQGDSTLLSITSNILNVINTPPTGLTGSYTYMSQVGVSIQKDGTMTLDSAALNSALSSDYSGVANLFAKSGQGYASRLGTVANQLLTSNGLITSRTDGLKTTLASVKDSEANMQSRLDLIQQSYLSQFTALDTMLGSLKTTSSYLTQQLANLPGFR